MCVSQQYILYTAVVLMLAAFASWGLVITGINVEAETTYGLCMWGPPVNFTQSGPVFTSGVKRVVIGGCWGQDSLCDTPTYNISTVFDCDATVCYSQFLEMIAFTGPRACYHDLQTTDIYSLWSATEQRRTLGRPLILYGIALLISFFAATTIAAGYWARKSSTVMPAVPNTNIEMTRLPDVGPIHV